MTGISIAGLLMLVSIVGCGSAPAPSADSESAVRLPGWEADTPGLRLTVPAGYSVRTKKGRDFDVHLLEPKSGSGGTGSIYVGHSPNPFYRRVESTTKVTETKQDIGGELVSVYEFTVDDDGEQLVFREAILGAVYADMSQDERLAELRVHLSASAASREEVDRLWKHLSSIRHE